VQTAAKLQPTHVKALIAAKLKPMLAKAIMNARAMALWLQRQKNVLLKVAKSSNFKVRLSSLSMMRATHYRNKPCTI
jgi:hypothetical protein